MSGCPSDCLSVCLLAVPSVFPPASLIISSVGLSLCVFVCVVSSGLVWSVCRFGFRRPSVCLICLCQYVRLSACLFVRLFVRLRPSVCLSDRSASVCLSACLLVCQSACSSASVSVCLCLFVFCLSVCLRLLVLVCLARLSVSAGHHGESMVASTYHGSHTSWRNHESRNRTRAGISCTKSFATLVVPGQLGLVD